MRHLLAVGLLAAAAAWGQVTTATFYGIVTDPAGAVVPGAAVTFTHEATGAVQASSPLTPSSSISACSAA